MAYSSIKRKKTGTRFEVYNGMAQQTSGWLPKNKLTKHDGIIYSKKEYEMKKQKEQNLKKKSKQKQMSPKKKQKSWADIMNELNN